MSAYKCPLCGKDLIENEKFCRDCQEIAVNRFSPQLLNSSQNEIVEELIQLPETIAPPIPKKRGRPKKVKDVDKIDNVEQPTPQIETAVAVEIVKEEQPISPPPQTDQEMEQTPVLQQVEVAPVSDNYDNYDNYDEDYYNDAYHTTKKLTLSIIAAAILGLAVGGMATYMYAERKFAAEKAVEMEDAYWINISAQHAPSAYVAYLTEYPQGKYAEEANLKVEDLKNKEQSQWADLQKSDNVYTYLMYLSQNPNTEYASQIQIKIDSLTWIEAQKQNTAEAFLLYLHNVKQGNITGKYAIDAEERYAYLSQIKTIDGNEAVLVNKNVNAFFKNLSENRYSDIKNAMNQTVYAFFDQKNQTNSAIVEWLKNDLKTNKIKSIVYTVDTDLAKITKDNKKVYSMSVPLEKRITFATNKKENSKMMIHIELNAKKQIQAVVVE